MDPLSIWVSELDLFIHELDFFYFHARLSPAKVVKKKKKKELYLFHALSEL